MDMTLIRSRDAEDGIFGELSSSDGFFKCVTLEHAYANQTMDLFIPKIPPGVFICVRGSHQLEGMSAPFETFEITGVPGHTNLLFHVGNYNRDSNGCVLVGDKVVKFPSGMSMITNSREVFTDFMDFQEGFDVFELTVV